MNTFSLETMLSMFATPAMIDVIQKKIAEFIMEVTNEYRTTPATRVGLMVVPVPVTNGDGTVKYALDIHIYADGKSVQKVTIQELMDEMKKAKA